jgi:alanine racemase
MNRRTFLTSTGAAALALPALSHLSEATPQSLPPPDISKSFEPWLDIKLDAFTWNVEQLSARAGNRPVMAVLKDNAYGHGLVGVASHLDTVPQVNSFAVVKIQEAIDIKNSSARKPVVLLGPTTDEELEYVVAHDIIPSVYHDRSRFMQSLSVKYQKKIKTHLYVDTGMGRVGVPYYQAMPHRAAVFSTSPRPIWIWCGQGSVCMDAIPPTAQQKRGIFR